MTLVGPLLLLLVLGGALATMLGLTAFPAVRRILWGAAALIAGLAIAPVVLVSVAAGLFGGVPGAGEAPVGACLVWYAVLVGGLAACQVAGWAWERTR